MPEVGNYQDPNAPKTAGAILPQGEHACSLTSVVLGKGKDFNTQVEIDQWEFTFESMTRKDMDGKPEVITLWCGVNYGNDKAKLTKLLDQVFGRSLTREEYRVLDFAKMVGMKGWVMVLPHTKQDGTKTTKFGAFRHPEGVAVPSPSQFAASGAPIIPVAPAAPQAAFPAPSAAPFPTAPAAGTAPNPWGATVPQAPIDTNGTGAAAPF